MNWLLAGCLDWLKQGLAPPASVTEATEAYRNEMNHFGRFADECLVGEVGKRLPSKELYEHYKKPWV